MTPADPPPPASALPLPAGLALLVATGCVDAYVFLAHGHVFAQAMTGNLVLVGVGAVDPSIVAFWRPLVTFAAFVVGATVARVVGRASPPRTPQLATIAVEIAVLTAVGFLPATFPDAIVTCAVAFAAGLQIATFNRIGATRFTTVVMTSNALATVDAALRALATRTRSDVQAAVRLLGALAAFVAGVFVGAVVTEAAGGRAAWVAAALFAVAGGLYLARPPAPLPARERPVSSTGPLDG